MSATALLRPIVAIVPLSRYWKRWSEQMVFIRHQVPQRFNYKLFADVNHHVQHERKERALDEPWILSFDAFILKIGQDFKHLNHHLSTSMMIDHLRFA